MKLCFEKGDWKQIRGPKIKSRPDNSRHNAATWHEYDINTNLIWNEKITKTR